MKHLFIVNPIAGGKDSTETIEAYVRSAFAQCKEPYEVYRTTGPHDAEETVRRTAHSGEAVRVYACGGDGTFNECVNGAAGCDNIAVAPIPIGTGNDFCRMFGEEKNLYLDFPALLQGTTHKIDLIAVNGRFSSCICSAGIDARVGINVHRYSSLPFCKGGGAYVVSAVVELFKGITRNMTLTCGDFSFSGKATLCCVCNGRYYGGGFNPSPDAMPDDGILDIYFVREMNLLQVATAIGAYAKGRADEFPKYITHLKGDSVTVEFDEEEIINVDGEGFHAKKAEIKLIPQALNLIIPKGLTFFESSC